MRPVNQVPLSLMAMKRSPFGSSRNPDSPPKPRNREVRIKPLRYSSDPNRKWPRSRVSKEGSGRALTSIETGTATESSSGLGCFGGGWTPPCGGAISGTAIAESPAADFRKRRRLRGSGSVLMVRRHTCAVSNHDDTPLILRDAAKTPLLRMRHSVAAMRHLIQRVTNVIYAGGQTFLRAQHPGSR